MKTYEEIRREVLSDIKRAEEMSLKPKEYSYAQIETMAAKEYAKQWVEEASKNCGYYCSGDGDACGPDNEDILNLIKKIDAQ